MKKLIRSAQLEQDSRLLVVHDYAEVVEAVVEAPNPATAEEETFETAVVEQHELEPVDSDEVEEPTEVAAEQPPAWQPSAVLEQEYRDRKEQEIDQAREQAKQAGYDEGYESGVAAGKLEYEEAAEQLRALLRSTLEAQSDNIGALEDTAIEIVFEAVTKILGERLVTPEGVAACVREVIRHAEQQAHMVVHVSPSDYRLLTDGKEQAVFGNDAQDIEIRPDERVSLGGCLLETGGGSLDGRLEVQLKQLKETLLLARSHPAGVEPE